MIYIYVVYVPHMDLTWIARNRELLLDFSGFSIIGDLMSGDFRPDIVRQYTVVALKVSS